MSDIVERLLMAQFRLDDGPEVATMERQAEVDRLAAILRERIAAGDACQRILVKAKDDYLRCADENYCLCGEFIEWDGITDKTAHKHDCIITEIDQAEERHRAAVEACDAL